MHIVDTALAARAEAGRPLRFGMIGAGYMGRGIANQVLNYMPGMQLSAICNRSLPAAIAAYTDHGVPRDRIVVVETADRLEDALRNGCFAVTTDPAVLCDAPSLEGLVEATGHVEHGAHVTMQAILRGKHMVLMNAELDATVGPLLRHKADAAGVILSGCDGDQPGVQLNLVRFVQSIGLVPRVCGNIKGLQDRYRTPETQAAYARQWGQTAHMVTSFADGTKISFEQAIVANATGMQVAQRGMIGIEHRGHVDDMTGLYDLDQLRALGGIVDYVVGGLPSPGVYVFAEAQDKVQAHYLNYGKLGTGPLYSFYIPYHLMVFEVPLSVARVVLLGDRVIAPKGGPVVDVVAVAKCDLSEGTVLDGIGGFHTYGVCENYRVSRAENLLPMGITASARLKRSVHKDQVLTYADVELPSGSLACSLRAEQDGMFHP
ncbi:Predicted homoserine dehydrogenase, contains C-terminal SAF domain [Loktanella fryxellensis]|uniref:Predicted homoserine dehydrogenase, contains C-terminal SAF domain n=1 Tax=Loktanella fryxellensis TaxID=245187 RepID=A0A1H8H390_9RHOB|nr:NAD(P)-dependent oxidoreductase [Loktanella fryxellensis]SEN50706.1 Predicted homoserine dehydrogenase, contains C-terminal SAF domain [Loktanella fryxellensis]